MSWNEERVGILKDLWKLGFSASKIARTMGGLTRNAVLGKAHRINLQNTHPRPSHQATGRRKQGGTNANVVRRVAEANADRASTHRLKRRKTNGFNSPISLPALPLPEQFVAQYMVPQEAPGNVFEAVLALRGISGAGQCRYPIGDPSQPGFHFCNLDGAPGKAYCAEHCRETHQAPRQR